MHIRIVPLLAKLKSHPHTDMLATRGGHSAEFNSFADAVFQAQISLGITHLAESLGYFHKGAYFSCFNQRDSLLSVYHHPLTAGYKQSEAGKRHQLKCLAMKGRTFLYTSLQQVRSHFKPHEVVVP